MVIPYLEEHFRMIRKPFARILTGGSTGGWEALALQLYHPDFFGGVWTFYPDPVDLRRYNAGLNIYADENAFTITAPSSTRKGWQTAQSMARRVLPFGTRASGRE